MLLTFIKYFRSALNVSADYFCKSRTSSTDNTRKWNRCYGKQENAPASSPACIRNLLSFLVMFLYILWWAYSNSRQGKLVFSNCNVSKLGVRKIVQGLGWKTDPRVKLHERSSICSTKKRVWKYPPVQIVPDSPFRSQKPLPLFFFFF